MVLVHYYIVNNDYQQDSRVFWTFFSNKSFGQLSDISLKNFIFSKTFDSEFSYIEVWFTDLNSKPLKIEDKMNINLVINWSVKYKKMTRYSVQPRDEYFQKGVCFCLLLKIWRNILVKM